MEFDIFIETVFFLAGGRSFFKWNSAKISVEFLELEYFLKFRSFDRGILGFRYFKVRLGFGVTP